jgi:hypothetical protein
MFVGPAGGVIAFKRGDIYRIRVGERLSWVDTDSQLFIQFGFFGPKVSYGDYQMLQRHWQFLVNKEA